MRPSEPSAPRASMVVGSGSIQRFKSRAKLKSLTTYLESSDAATSSDPMATSPHHMAATHANKISKRNQFFHKSNE
ncbi:hypothetical protein V6N12_069435 [Hibiscus sabdariffa]|uniref:Uncharacterized protein n=1 Tax=Hibiscus sabdariffa TaxID=183260 RepID=A0ABR2FDU8_9ROSI